MINTILSDLSRVVLNPKDKNYTGSLNDLHKKVYSSPGFNFHDYFELNEEILNFYQSFKSRDISVDLFTTGSIQNSPEIKNRLEDVFDRIFSAEELGLEKTQPEAYEFIAANLNVKPSEILYIDDQLINIEAARRADLNVIEYQEFQELANKVKESLNL